MASTIEGGPRSTLSSILTFRTRGNEFYFTPRMVSRECVHSQITARRHINELVRLGVLTKVPSRTGVSRLNLDKIHPRPELIDRKSRPQTNLFLVKG